MQKTKHKATEITEADLNAFLENASDFSFEMKVLKRMKLLKFECVHGGVYIDPLESKARQFDIKAYRTQGKNRLCLSIECKSISKKCPVLVHTVQRTRNEAFHELFTFPRRTNYPRVARQSQSLYPENSEVGKKMDQLKKVNGELQGGDRDMFGRINQAQNSAYTLICDAAVGSDIELSKAIVPVLVVPDETLWTVSYDEDGVRADPKQASRVSFFLGQSFQSSHMQLRSQTFVISHTEIVTYSALSDLVRELQNGAFCDVA